MEYIPLGQYALFKSFFPQLVAGPIVRVHQLLPQLKKLSTPTLSDFSIGVALFAEGFFKKIALADRIAPAVDEVFAQPQIYGRGTLIMAVVGYSVQIWADFSGYTSMGRGCARAGGTAHFSAPPSCCVRARGFLAPSRRVSSTSLAPQRVNQDGS